MKRLFLLVLLLSGFLVNSEGQDVKPTLSPPAISVNINHGYGYRTVRHRRKNGNYYYKRHYYTAPREKNTSKKNAKRNYKGHDHKKHKNNGHRKND